MVDVQSIEMTSHLPELRRARVKQAVKAPEPSAPTPSEAARSAGLRYLPDDVPGITRHSAGSGFTYKGPEGRRISDAATLARIRALAIPPAWTCVWISPFDDTHLAATGRDAKGRKQYRYHPDFAAIRDASKYERLAAFARSLPSIRRKRTRHQRLPGLPREKVLATLVALLEETGIRIGNEEYAKTNGSFGLTTLRNKHVRVKGEEVLFTFRGKSGKDWRIPLRDRRIARIVRTCQDLPGQHLFEYLGEDGTPQKISSSDVNAYLREITGSEITAKDFRTWTGTVDAALAFDGLARQGIAPTKKVVKQVMAQVAGRLGNTIAICRKCYVHPGVVTAFIEGKLALEFAPKKARGTSLRKVEHAVLCFLESAAESVRA
jgi:DNA topoisomerase I